MTDSDEFVRRQSSNGYENLTYFEKHVIGQFFNNFDKSLVNELLNSGEPLTVDGRRFISDVMSENIRPAKGQRGNKDDRDFKIYWRMELLLFDGHSHEQARYELAELFHLSEDGIKSAYNKIKRKQGGKIDFTKVEDFVIDDMRSGFKNINLW